MKKFEKGQKVWYVRFYPCNSYDLPELKYGTIYDLYSDGFYRIQDKFLMIEDIIIEERVYTSKVSAQKCLKRVKKGEIQYFQEQVDQLEREKMIRVKHIRNLKRGLNGL